MDEDGTPFFVNIAPDYSDEDLENIAAVIDRQLPGFQLAADYAPPDEWTVSGFEEDTSPTWEEIFNELQEIAAEDAADRVCVGTFGATDRILENARLFPVWSITDAAEAFPSSVLIATVNGEDVVIGIH